MAILKSIPSGGPSSTTLLSCAAVEGFTEAEVLVAVEAEPVACTVEVTVSWVVWATEQDYSLGILYCVFLDNSQAPPCYT